MRAVVQRVTEARVVVEERTVGEIGAGLLVLLGIAVEDDAGAAEWMADKLLNLRMFSDHEDKMNHSVIDANGEVLLVSQFTLYGDARKGRRPSFIRAARGSEARTLYELVLSEIEAAGVPTASGEFGAMMQVELTNDGPITILLDSERGF
ncbi:MAG TPA: D-aminoacyl-tRNA deacylase [Actinomycetota bacterium]|nr:D-aminoacyl-tRNA deacylase [Actinomycetota bacterium]